MIRLALTIATCLFLALGRCPAQEIADFSSLKITSTGEDGKMLDFAFSKNQKYFAIANEGKIIKLFDGRTGKYLKEIEGYQDDVIEIRLTDDGTYLVTLGFDNSLALIEVASGKILQTIKFRTKLRCLDIDASGTLAVLGDKNGIVHYVNLKKGEVIREVDTGAPQVSSIAFSPDYSMIAAGTGVALGLMFGNSHPIFILGTDGKIKSTLDGANGATTSMKFSADGKWLYTGHKANARVIIRWDLASGSRTKIAEYINLTSNSGYNSLEVSDNDAIIIATTDDNAIEIYDLKTNSQATSIKGKGRTKIRLARKLDHFPKRIFSINGGKNFVIGGFNQNLLYIFNAEQRGVIGYIHSFNNQWAVIAADGRMDGSLNAIQNLIWKVGIDEIPLEDTFERNFSPQLLSQLITEDKVRGEFKVENFVSRVPKISLVAANDQKLLGEDVPNIKSTQKQVKLSVAVTAHLDEVSEIRVYNNSKLVATQPGDPSQNTYTFDLSLSNVNGPENYIYAIASSRSGIDSEKKRLIANYEGQPEADPKLYLVTIGINKYRNPKYNLNYALADANAIHNEVKTGANSLFSEVIQYNIRDTKATRPAIIKAFEEIESTALEQDMLVFYYAGHGVMSDNDKSDFYLVPYDVTQLYGRSDLLESKAVSASELKELSKRINAQKQVFILDACQSAGALEAVARGAAEEKAIAQLARSTGTFWITATGSDQFATEFEALGHGVFTYSILEGLSGKADNGDKRLTVKELSAYIESRVPELSEQYKGSPQFPSGYSFGNDFPLTIIND